jgi:hypothetical protein
VVPELVVPELVVPELVVPELVLPELVLAELVSAEHSPTMVLVAGLHLVGCSFAAELRVTQQSSSMP